MLTRITNRLIRSIGYNGFIQIPTKPGELPPVEGPPATAKVETDFLSTVATPLVPLEFTNGGFVRGPVSVSDITLSYGPFDVVDGRVADIFYDNQPLNKASRIVPSLPASAKAAWDARHYEDIDGLIPDLTGYNEWHLLTTGTKPVLGADVDGRRYLQFTAATTAPMITDTFEGDDFFDAVDGNWAMILVATIESAQDGISNGNVLGPSNLRRSIRALTTDYSVQESQVGGITSTTSRWTTEPVREIVVANNKDGVLRVRHFSLANSWGEPGRAATQQVSSDNTDTTTGPSTPTGGLYLNIATHGMKFYGAVYLDNPTDSDIEEAAGFAMDRWVLPGNKNFPVVFYQGDSTTHVDNIYPTRVPGWNAALHTDHLPAQVFGQNHANGGRAIIRTAPIGAMDATDDSIYYTAAKFCVWAGRPVYYALMIGTNDIGRDGAAASDVADACEDWAADVRGFGAIPLWLGCCPDHQGDSAGTLRNYVSTHVRDSIVAGTSNFAGVVDVLENDALWGWTNQANTTAPSFMDDTTHPNTLGNEDIAAKFAPEFLQIVTRNERNTKSSVLDAIQVSIPLGNGTYTVSGSPAADVDGLPIPVSGSFELDIIIPDVPLASINLSTTDITPEVPVTLTGGATLYDPVTLNDGVTDSGPFGVYELALGYKEKTVPDFDGTSGLINCGSIANYQTDFSVSMFVRRSGAGSGALPRLLAHATTGIDLGVVASTEKIQFNGVDATTTLSLDVWYHVAVVVTSGSIATIYINGVSDGSGSVTIAAPSGVLRIANKSAGYFQGSISDARIYDSALSPTYIAAIAAGQSIDILPTAHFKLDGNDYDSSGNGNHGTVSGGVTWVEDADCPGINYRNVAGENEGLSLSTGGSGSPWDLANTWMSDTELTGDFTVVWQLLSDSLLPLIGLRSSAKTATNNYNSGMWLQRQGGTTARVFFNGPSTDYTATYNSGSVVKYIRIGSTVSLFIDDVLITTRTIAGSLYAAHSSGPTSMSARLVYIAGGDTGADATATNFTVTPISIPASDATPTEDVLGNPLTPPVPDTIHVYPAIDAGEYTVEGTPANSGTLAITGTLTVEDIPLATIGEFSSLDTTPDVPVTLTGGATLSPLVALKDTSDDIWGLYDTYENAVGYLPRVATYYNGAAHTKIPSAAQFQFGDSATDSPFSISLTFRTDAFGAGKGGVLAKATSNVTNTCEYSIAFGDTGTLGFYLYDNTTSHQIRVVTDSPLDLDRYYQLAVTYDGSGDESGLNIYLDGVLAAATQSTVGTYVAMHATTCDVTIAQSLRDNGSFVRKLTGVVGDVQWFAEELSATDVEDLHNGLVVGTTRAAWYHLNEDKGTRRFDCTGNGAHGQNSSGVSPIEDADLPGINWANYAPGNETWTTLETAPLEIAPYGDISAKTAATIACKIKTTDTDFILFGRPSASGSYVLRTVSGDTSTTHSSGAGSYSISVDSVTLTGVTRDSLYDALADGIEHDLVLTNVNLSLFTQGFYLSDNYSSFYFTGEVWDLTIDGVPYPGALAPRDESAPTFDVSGRAITPTVLDTIHVSQDLPVDTYVVDGTPANNGTLAIAGTLEVLPPTSSAVLSGIIFDATPEVPVALTSASLFDSVLLNDGVSDLGPYPVYENALGYVTPRVTVFDGSSGYLTCGTSLTLASSWSFSAWVRRGAINYSSLGGIFSFATGSANVYIYDVFNQIVANNCFASIASFGVGSWFHVAGTNSATGSKLYINGVLIDSTGGSAPTGSNTLRIGVQSASNYFAGALADFRIANGVVWSPTEIADIYANKYPATLPSRLWRLDEPSGTRYDAIGGSSNGTIIGGVTSEATEAFPGIRWENLAGSNSGVPRNELIPAEDVAAAPLTSPIPDTIHVTDVLSIGSYTAVGTPAKDYYGDPLAITGDFSVLVAPTGSIAYEGDELQPLIPVTVNDVLSTFPDGVMLLDTDAVEWGPYSVVGGNIVVDEDLPLGIYTAKQDAPGLDSNTLPFDLTGSAIIGVGITSVEDVELDPLDVSVTDNWIHIRDTDTGGRVFSDGEEQLPLVYAANHYLGPAYVTEIYAPYADPLPEIAIIATDGTLKRVTNTLTRISLPTKPTGRTVVNVSTPTELLAAINSTTPNRDIVIADGYYSWPAELQTSRTLSSGKIGADITIQAAPAATVVIDGSFQSTRQFTWFPEAGDIYSLGHSDVRYDINGEVLFSPTTLEININSGVVTGIAVDDVVRVMANPTYDDVYTVTSVSPTDLILEKVVETPPAAPGTGSGVDIVIMKEGGGDRLYDEGIIRNLAVVYGGNKEQLPRWNSRLQLDTALYGWAVEGTRIIMKLPAAEDPSDYDVYFPGWDVFISASTTDDFWMEGLTITGFCDRGLDTRGGNNVGIKQCVWDSCGARGAWRSLGPAYNWDVDGCTFESHSNLMDWFTTKKQNLTPDLMNGFGTEGVNTFIVVSSASGTPSYFRVRNCLFTGGYDSLITQGFKYEIYDNQFIECGDDGVNVAGTNAELVVYNNELDKCHSPLSPSRVTSGMVLWVNNKVTDAGWYSPADLQDPLVSANSGQGVKTDGSTLPIGCMRFFFNTIEMKPGGGNERGIFRTFAKGDPTASPPIPPSPFVLLELKYNIFVSEKTGINGASGATVPLMGLIDSDYNDWHIDGHVIAADSAHPLAATVAQLYPVFGIDEHSVDSPVTPTLLATPPRGFQKFAFTQVGSDL